MVVNHHVLRIVAAPSFFMSTAAWLDDMHRNRACAGKDRGWI